MSTKAALYKRRIHRSDIETIFCARCNISCLSVFWFHCKIRKQREYLEWLIVEAEMRGDTSRSAIRVELHATVSVLECRLEKMLDTKLYV